MTACHDLKSSVKFVRLLGIVLEVGNSLNKGTSKGGAKGIQLDSLMKLTQTRTNSGQTLLEYIVVHIRTKCPELLKLHEVSVFVCLCVCIGYFEDFFDLLCAKSPFKSSLFKQKKIQNKYSRCFMSFTLCFFWCTKFPFHLSFFVSFLLALSLFFFTFTFFFNQYSGFGIN